MNVVADLAPSLCAIFMQVVCDYSDDTTFNNLVPVIVERITQLYPLEGYEGTHRTSNARYHEATPCPEPAQAL